MDGRRFDRFARGFQVGASRRSVLRGMAAALGAVLTARAVGEAEAACRLVGEACRLNSECCGTSFCNSRSRCDCRPTFRVEDRRCRCPAGFTACCVRCRNLQTDEQNCGRCGRACAAGRVCRDGRCDGDGAGSVGPARACTS